MNNSEIHLFRLNNSFRDFDEYQKLMESFLELKKEELNSEFNILHKKFQLKNDAGSEFRLEDLHEEYHAVDQIFPYNFRASFFVQIISMIEFELKNICEHHHRVCKTDISIKDLKGNSEIEKAKSYLTKICKVNFNNLNPEWTFIGKAKDLRNIFIHHQGELVLDNSTKSRSINGFIHSKDYLEFYPKEEYDSETITTSSNDGIIMIKSKKANEELLFNAQKFFSKLLKNELKYFS